MRRTMRSIETGSSPTRIVVKLANHGGQSRSEKRFAISGDVLVSFHFDDGPIEVGFHHGGADMLDLHMQ